MQNKQDKEFFFFDEARFGTHSKLGHGWFPKGSRTGVKVKLGFQNFYVYSAVNAISGQDFSLILPKVNSLCMNEFLAQMAKGLQGQEAVVIMDCAGWHKSKSLEIPHNIQIMFLPPYSPELNPVEKLWQYIKSNTIKNRVYENIQILENTIADFINELNPDEIKHTCSLKHSLS